MCGPAWITHIGPSNPSFGDEQVLAVQRLREKELALLNEKKSLRVQVRAVACLHTPPSSHT